MIDHEIHIEEETEENSNGPIYHVYKQTEGELYRKMSENPTQKHLDQYLSLSI